MCAIALYEVYLGIRFADKNLHSMWNLLILPSNFIYSDVGTTYKRCGDHGSTNEDKCGQKVTSTFKRSADRIIDKDSVILVSNSFSGVPFHLKRTFSRMRRLLLFYLLSPYQGCYYYTILQRHLNFWNFSGQEKLQKYSFHECEMELKNALFQ